MKKRILFIGSLVLLLAVIGYMVKDLFFTEPDRSANQYDYGLSELRKNDSAGVAYQEIRHFTPGLEDIYGIATDPADRIFVSGAGGVEIFTSEGRLIHKFPFEEAVRCITVAPNGNLLLGMQDHVEIMTPDGKTLHRWNPVSEQSILTSIATNGHDIFVADAGKKVVYRYDESGNLVNRIGEKDTANGIPGFIVPSPWFDLRIGRDDELWVVNPGRHLLEAFTPDGKIISSWGKSSMQADGFCGCCNPSNFALLSNGSFVTSEKGIERVKVSLPSGEFTCLVAAPNQFETGTKGLDLVVDSRDRILVLDPWKKQVRIFVSKTNAFNKE
ncbi:MAG: hypothetical protein V1733_02195 [bacterium]